MSIKTLFRMLVMIVAITLSLLFTACVDEVQIDREFDEAQKLVLYSRLCPQLDTTYILLTNTTLLYTSAPQETLHPENGVVELSADGSHWVRAGYLPDKQRFFLTKQEFPIEEGGTYYIRASYPGYEDVSAFCTVPRSHDVGFRFDTVSANGDVHLGEIYNWPHRDVYAEWRDVPGEANYYALMQKTLFTHHYFGDGDDPVITFYYWDYYTVWMYRNNKDYQYVSDEGCDGALMRFMVEENLPEEGSDYWDDDDEEDDDDDEEETYYLVFLDRGCYLYEKTLNDNDLGLDMNFLLLEPVHIYTNIENGFGLFGAFCMVPVPAR
ncbi:MAG: DUF4249 domain-containing protein [Bacteroidales bacterium]|nr:DUF4249 domain-containing protein [Bacteroidales bacterium]